MYSLPVIEDSAEVIAKFKYNHPRAWDFDFKQKGDKKIMRGLFCETNPEYSDRSWREIAILT